MTWRILGLVVAINFLFFSSLVFAQNSPGQTVNVNNGKFIPSSCTDITNCTFDKIFGFDEATDSLFGNLLNYAVLVIAVPLTTVAIVYAGITIVSNPASSSKREEGKRILYMAVWGLVITLSAYLIIKTIFNSLTSNNYPIQL